MRILMLDNSFTFYNDMPKTLAQLTGAEVVAHTRGGAWLAEQLNQETEMGRRTLAALEQEKWDFVVMQEQSHGAITAKASFMKSVAALCEKARAAGAVPVLYATWAYARDCDRLAELGLTYDEMALKLNESYHEAAEQNQALVAEVGMHFHDLADSLDLYTEDRKHPNEYGSFIAADVLADVMVGKNKKLRQGSTQQITEAEMRMLDRFFREEIEAKRLDDSFARLREELRHLPPMGDDETSLY